MKAIDLFCGAGGATRGLQQAGFHVTGVDIKPQPRYCGDAFIKADITKLRPEILIPELREFDFIWASPPCQAHTSMKTMHNARQHKDLIPQTRELLQASGRPWIMENVPGAPMRYSLMLCGTMFGLGVDDADLLRHRNFESSFLIMQPGHCQHGRKRTIGIYGEGCRDSRRKYDKGLPEFTVDDGRAATDIDWMTLAELCQAIPPAYGEYIGRAAMKYLQARAA